MQPSDFKPGEAVLLKLTEPVEVAVVRLEGNLVIVEVQATPDMLTKLQEGTTTDVGGGLA